VSLRNGGVLVWKTSAAGKTDLRGVSTSHRRCRLKSERIEIAARELGQGRCDVSVELLREQTRISVGAQHFGSAREIGSLTLPDSCLNA
jgi:hypothetical protein